eukprot:TRINITY_DN39375_c0_g1_i1.p1 TRINITY_DN39375_c0_g1~~TRINITY_DN39375_c0_g1_i1.p1  ORF type:complete len:493 (+),score=116.98 TRINITY_DN39375_c0_g1_i1:31-1509(+)
MPGDPTGTPDNAFEADFKIGKVLGKGHYSTVYEVCRRADGAVFAAKVIDKSKLDTEGLGDALREVSILQEIGSHRRISQYEQHFDLQHQLVIVLELAEGGALFTEIVNRRHYAEADAQMATYNLLQAIQHFHAKSIVHRDLKPENILLASPVEDDGTDPVDHPDSSTQDVTDIKLTDFGFAEKITPAGLTKCLGTPLYIAPEVLNAGLFKTGEPYALTADMWSLGVIVYILLCGYPPFRGRSTNEQFKAIVKGAFSFPPARVWGMISDEAKDFVANLLVLDSEDRMTAGQALKHPWMQGVLERLGGDVTEVPAGMQAHLKETVSNLIEFNASQQWRKGVFSVEAITRLRYAAACRNLNIRPNSEIQKIFDDSTSEDMRVLDLTRNYLGPKGLLAVLPILSDQPSVQTVILRGNGVTNAVIEVLCQVLRDHKGVQSIDLSHNPISHIAGRQLLTLLQTNTNITQLDLAGTALLDTTVMKIAARLGRNQQLCRA